jgi:predicted outer membrane repeat protein
VSDSSLTSNSAFDGGGIDNFGTETVTGSTLSSNSATFGGGLAKESGATATVIGGTFTSNTASVDGGGIKNFGTLTQSGNTFTGNSPNNIS